MKRLLIIGASILQLPAVKRAKEMGLYVGVADFNPHAIAIPYADEYFNVSTIDEQGIYEAAKKFGADGIMTLATDMPMRALAFACEKLGLVGISYDTAVKSTDKAAMIRAFEEYGVAHPWFHIVDGKTDAKALLEQISFPCITKPTDNSGSRGVMMVENEKEFMEAVRYSSGNGRRGSVIVEELLIGNEVSVEVLAYQGTPHVIQITDKLTTGAPHFVEMGHSQPGRFTPQVWNSIVKLAEDAVRAVGIQNGPAHVEMMVTKNGPKMIELGARLGGDCITTHLVPLSTGVDMVKAVIDVSLGEKPDFEVKFNKCSAARFITPDSRGEIAAINGTETALKVPCVTNVEYIKSVGDQLKSVESSGDRLGCVIAQAENLETAVSACEKASDAISVEMKKQKKVLFLGGFPQMIDIVHTAKSMGLYTIVVDRDPESPAKKVADESFDLSTDRIDDLEQFCREREINGIFNGFEDFNIHVACELCKRLNLHFYGTEKQINTVTDKAKFKHCCRRYNVPVVEQFTLELALSQGKYPYIVKPVDSYGSRGIMICRTEEQLKMGYENALGSSRSKHVIIERFIDTNHGVEMFYTVVNGHIHLTVTADRYTSRQEGTSVPLPVAEVFPSRHREAIYSKLDKNIRKMLQGMGIQNGLILIQALYDGQSDFFIYEMAYRFTGEQHYMLYEKQNGVSLAKMMLKLCLGEDISEFDNELLDDENFTKPAINLAMVIAPGEIQTIKGISAINTMPETVTLMQAQVESNVIHENVDYSHILLRVNMIADNYAKLQNAVAEADEKVTVTAADESDMRVSHFRLPEV